MPMREDCKYFQSRTYPSGDTARFCALDLAPEAPWRCPAACPRYERRVDTGGYARGSFAAAPLLPEPASDAGLATLLGSAEEIISAAGPEIEAEEQRRQRVVARARWWDKLRRTPRWHR